MRFNYRYAPEFLHQWSFEYVGPIEMRDFNLVESWCEERFGLGLSQNQNPKLTRLANEQRVIYMFTDEKAAMEFRLRWC